MSLAEGARRLPRARVLDLRDPGRFAHGHPADAGRISEVELRERRMELPSRDESVLVVDDDPAGARRVAEQLVQLGYFRVAWLDAPLESDAMGLVSRQPPARLWSPSSFLERVQGRLRRGRALDLACGSGRAAVFLAGAGFEVEGWDVDTGALRLARKFAEREAVTVAFRQVDLEAGGLPASERAFDLIVVIRYLHRDLFAWIERSLAPGGALVYETFRQGQERFGHPQRARHLLESGELRRAFPSLVVDLHEETSESEPPVLARLLAHRP